MKKLISCLLLGLLTTAAHAAIPRASFIVGKVAENCGNGTYVIDQDVHFTTANSNLTLKEQWLVSTDGQMRVTVKPARDAADQVKIQFVYGGGQKTSLTQRGKTSGNLGEEFVEKFFHTRSRDVYFNMLANLRVLPASYANNKVTKTGKDFIYPAEPLSRLTRTAGVITYAFGEAAGSETDTHPMAWVEQDVFHLRKLRFPSGTIMTADRYGSYARDLALPKFRQIVWGDRSNPKSVTMQVTKVASLPTTKGDKRFQAAGLEFNSQIAGLSDPEMQKLVEEFYARFR